MSKMTDMRKIAALILLGMVALGCQAPEAEIAPQLVRTSSEGNVSPEKAKNWQNVLAEQLPLLGHRNWVVVADSAYPWQTSAGIETIYTNQDQLSVLREVMSQLKRQKHVQPIIMLDKELDSVPEDLAPGVSTYRKDLAGVLGDVVPQKMLHEQIIAKLDETGKTFHVLLLKTNLTIPYTSVFLQLDCGYWGAAKEAKLRSLMGQAH